MMNFGKVLFFNEGEGKGIIITSQKEKIDFFVKEWNDFDVMPSLGLEVVFTIKNDQASDIISKDTHELQKNDTLNNENTPKEPEEEQAQEESEHKEKPEIEEETKQEESQEEQKELKQEEQSETEEESQQEQLKEEETKQEKNLEEESEQTEKEQPQIESEQEEVKAEEQQPKEEQPKQAEEESQQEQLKEEETKQEKNLEEESEQEETEEEEERPDSITISINISTAISNYFDTIKNHINSRSIYKKVSGSLDYILIKRFLFTTFNNLSDIDLHIITPKIRMLYDDLRALSNVYDDFIAKIKYPNLAYNEVFLSCQAEYMKIKTGAESTIEKLNRLRTDEEMLDGQLKVRKEDLAKGIKSEEFDALTYELKSLSGAYVDTVHLMAELDERYKYDVTLLKKFENEYRADFAEKFNTQALFFKKDLIKILNAQAFLLDSQLWQQAKKSKAVKAHFKESSISGELNTKTYLKYYLDSLDTDKITDETRKLFALYDYLLTVQKDYIMIVVSSAIDAMEYESSIKNLRSTYEVKAFVDEKSAVKWALNNSVKILIVEDRLQNVSVEKFLQVYKKHVTLSPKIVLLGEKPRASSYPITCLLSRNASARVVTDNIKSILDIKKQSG